MAGAAVLSAASPAVALNLLQWADARLWMAASRVGAERHEVARFTLCDV